MDRFCDGHFRSTYSEASDSGEHELRLSYTGGDRYFCGCVLVLERTEVLHRAESKG